MSLEDFERGKLIQQNAEKLAEDMIAEMRQELSSLQAQNAAMKDCLVAWRIQRHALRWSLEVGQKCINQIAAAMQRFPSSHDKAAVIREIIANAQTFNSVATSVLKSTEKEP